MSDEHKELWDMVIRLESHLDYAGINEKTWQMIEDIKNLLMTIDR